MKISKTRSVAYRRKREGKTDYRKRLKFLKSGRPRMVIRRSLRAISAQIIEYAEKGDKVIISAKSSDLEKFGWQYNFTNLPSAYLLGLLIAKKAKEKGINKVILDIGFNKSVPHSRIYAVLKGAVTNGLEVPHSEEVLPDDDRISGKHIEKYAEKIKNDQTLFKREFGGYIKKNLDPSNITKMFSETKNRIIGV